MECTTTLPRRPGAVDKPLIDRERQRITPRKPPAADRFLAVLAVLTADRELADVYQAGRLIALARQIGRN